MRWSIKQIFNNLSKTLLLLSITLGVLAFFSFTLNSSSKKVDLILHQKTLIKEAYEMGREDIQLSNIHLKGIINNLKYDIDNMADAFDYDILGNYVYGHSKEYIKDLEQLNIKQLLYIEAADAYYDQSLEELNKRLEDYDFTQEEYKDKLVDIQEKHLIYESDKLTFIQWLIYLSFIISLLTMLWFTRRLAFVYNDLKTLYSVDLDSKNRVYLTEEAEMITKRMSRKPTSGGNPAFIDPVTEINNYKGLLHGFSTRTGNSGASLSVCVYSLDNIRDVEKKYQKEFANQILKKAAFTLGLHAQHNDVLGRIDYDQFVLVINRPAKDIALKDSEQIREAIEETKFKTPTGGSVSLSVSAGFVTKTASAPLDQTIVKAKEVLAIAIEKGGKKVAELRDQTQKKVY